ncbi:MAG: Holliday junction branch migration protein RuvA [Bacteroidetes bacterium]|nr:Holliday junction branch migration protein RuvA [Bacteroidota bacterium]
MIGFLSGKIISLKPTKILLDVNGVGYVVFISINTFEEISNKEIVSLYIHTHVKEDSITLYGFHNESEKEIFELLISISGIGPKLALGVLSGIQTEDLKEAILNGDVSRMVAIPGIGKKTADRLILELRSKVGDVRVDGEPAVHHGVKQEAVSALTTLGYNYATSEKVVRQILSSSPACTLEELIKNSLSELNK